MTFKRNVSLSLFLALPAVVHAEESANRPAPPKPQKTEGEQNGLSLADVFTMVIQGIDLAKVENDPELEGSSSTIR